jgi:hypothetical protein
MKRWLWVLASAALLVSGAAGDEIWKLDRLDQVGGYATTVLGNPRVEERAGRRALVFDGVKDGIVLPVNPLAGRKQFTIEVCFWPAADGPPAQRFMHFRDDDDGRVLIETRVDAKRGWWLDTFLAHRENGKALADAKRAHAPDRWVWIALRYDGKTMAHFVDGQKELEAETDFPPMGSGETSIGVRLNRVFWFKGAIGELRFHDEALPEAKLQRAEPKS